MKLQEFKKLIREEVRKVINQRTTKKTVKEGVMSELDIIRQDSSSIQEFVKNAIAEYPQLKGKNAFLKDIWETGKQFDRENQ